MPTLIYLPHPVVYHHSGDMITEFIYYRGQHQWQYDCIVTLSCLKMKWNDNAVTCWLRARFGRLPHPSARLYY
jgi:hypothetical protein